VKVGDMVLCKLEMNDEPSDKLGILLRRRWRQATVYPGRLPGVVWEVMIGGRLWNLPDRMIEVISEDR